MKISRGRFAASGMVGLALAVVVVLFSFGVPEQQGCGGSASAPADEAADDLTATVCATQHTGKTHDGDAVIVCDKTYAAAPLVKPPADKGSTHYLALETGARVTMMVDRSGVEYAVIDGKGNPVATSSLPSSMRMPSNRNLFLIYSVTGTVGTWTDPVAKEKMPSIEISKATPYILLSPQAIDSSVTVLEGVVSKRTSDTAWDWKPSVPFRITVHSLDTARGLPVWGDTSKILPDGAVSNLNGSIDNWDKPVKSASGKCLPALTAMGKSNPFAGARSGDVRLYRMATMHFAGDQVMVLEYPSGTTGIAQSGMGGITVLHPAALIQTAKDPRWHMQEIHPHAAPNGNVVQLSPATGGGGGC